MPRFDVNKNLKTRFQTTRKLTLLTAENLLDIKLTKLDLAEGLLSAGKELNDDEAKLVKAFVELEEAINRAYDMSVVIEQNGA